jgi:formylglycine-generating enzyme required for sulfatase activity
MIRITLLFMLPLLLSAVIAPPRKIKAPKGFVYVPSGTTKSKNESFSVQGFFMKATEVTNSEYREFLNDLSAKGRTEDLAIAQIRAEGWKNAGTFMQPFVEHYHSHPAYDNYPVVNITKEAAQLYCSWLQEKLEAKMGQGAVMVRLPTEKEWEYAAMGGRENYPYPHGYNLRNAKGNFLYQFTTVGDEAVCRDSITGTPQVQANAGRSSSGGIGPAPAKSYFPNDYGLYNTSGNVAEMLLEEGRTKGGSFQSTGYDIRIDAPDAYAGFAGASPYIGFRPVVSFR